MLNRLRSLFEEDIEMKDAIEDLDGLTDDSEDIIIGVIEDRYKDTNPHLFTEPTQKEIEEKANIDKLLSDDDDIDDIDISDEEVDVDDLFDDDDF